MTIDSLLRASWWEFESRVLHKQPLALGHQRWHA